jgi:hypothetical protein
MLLVRLVKSVPWLNPFSSNDIYEFNQKNVIVTALSERVCL